MNIDWGYVNELFEKLRIEMIKYRESKKIKIPNDEELKKPFRNYVECDESERTPFSKIKYYY